MGKRDIERAVALLESRAAEHGLELVTLEVAGRSRQPIVRVFLDREGGIDLDTVAEANAWVSETLDEAGAIVGPYTLEVSSPGIERPLVKLADFERFAGEDASVKTSAPIEGRSNFTGRIAGTEGDVVMMEVGSVTYRIPHSAVAKARLKPQIEIGQGRGAEAR